MLNSNIFASQKTANLLKSVDEAFNDCLKESLKSHTLQFTLSECENQVPSKGKDIKKMYDSSLNKNTPFYVFSGSNEASLLTFSQETNLLYRAMHDIDHALSYDHGLGTTSLKSEMFLNCFMAYRLYDYLVKRGDGEQFALMAFYMVYHDTVGQALYYSENQGFVVNQRVHTLNLLNECKGYAMAKQGLINISRQFFKVKLVECGVNYGL